MDLKQRESHFEFGANWLSFLDSVSDERVEEAVRGLERLFPDGELAGKRFLDIGCGSGLSMLAALKLGAASVVGVDIDENSVEAATRCLSRFAAHGPWQVARASVFDPSLGQLGSFDVVHSWGVLHHSGDLWKALETATTRVNDGGLLAVALYRKTPFCRFWSVEKSIYSNMPPLVQAPVRLLYEAAFLTAKTIRGANPASFVREYKKSRGMSWTHDVHDWLGGYPYESASAEEVRERLGQLGFRMLRENVRSRAGIGLFGSGCDEFVAQRA
ncbi:MAG TPA: class I SAM-dependent methyltransferase [Gammaproteobacteria bacterium]|nr:class I SAM-dependent methyltransferase [Gammaproteobacteria bacterium]